MTGERLVTIACEMFYLVIGGSCSWNYEWLVPKAGTNT